MSVLGLIFFVASLLISCYYYYRWWYEEWFKNYVELGYIRMDRLDYDENMVANYREQVVKDIVPITLKIRQRQAKRLGLEKLECYDFGYKFKTGNPKPHGSLDELVLAAK